MSTFTSRTYNFNTILGRSSFPDYNVKKLIVPQFQRTYSWEKTHVSTFWDDVLDFHENASQADTYFLGPVVILPENECISLLDGQQRLATATILLCAMRDLARKKGGQPGADFARDIHRDLITFDDEPDSYAMTLGEVDQPFFENAVQKDPPSTKEKASGRSHNLIGAAKAFLRARLEEYVEEVEGSELVVRLKSLKRTLSEKIKLVVIEVHSEEEAYHIFESLNDRGLRLSVPDLLLNFLMRSAKNAGERERIKFYWNHIRRTTRTARVGVFLRHMWISQFGDVKSQGLYRVIKTHLEDGVGTSVSFAKRCSEECESYAAIKRHDERELFGAAPHVKALVKSLSADKAYPLLLSGKECLNQDEFEKLAKYTLALYVRHQVFANLNPSQLEDVLYDTARNIRENKRAGKSSKEMLRLVKEKLKVVDPSRERIKEGLKETFLKKTPAQYVLGEIAATIQSRAKVLELTTATIEHVFPRSAELAKWPNLAELKPLVTHIGNQTLVERKINKNLGNGSFEDKCGEYAKSEILMTKNLSDEFSSWGEREVLNRAVSFAKFVDRIWSLD